ncbi:MAG TPA: hypothetical protein VD963_02690 [Phycisphaerales bacterium]|nr:hypothetical protein [Phycisphaerales bacterium]
MAEELASRTAPPGRGTEHPRPDDDVAALVVEVQRRLERVVSQARELGDERAELAAERARAEAQRRELDARRAELEHERARRLDLFRETEQELAARERALGERAAEIAHAAKELADGRAVLGERQARFETHRAGLEAASTALAERERQLQGRRAELDSLAEAIAEREAEVGVRREQNERAAAELARREAGLEARAAELRATESRLAERERACRSDADQRVEQATRQLEARLAEAERVAQDVRADRDSRALACQRFEATVRELEARLAADAGRRAGLEANIAGLTRHVERLEAEAAGREAASTGSAQEIEKRDLAIGVLKERLEAARRERDQAGAALEAARAEAGRLAQELATTGPRAEQAGSPAPAPSARVLRRQQRLALCTNLLRERTRKVMAAKQAVEKRQAECELLLAQRPKLVAAMEGVRAVERGLAARAARRGAAVLVACACVGLAVLAGLCWAVAGQAFPGVYAARGIVAADTGGRTLTEADLAAWDQFHQQIVRDPQFHAMAAERFAQRGLAHLASPAAVGARVLDALYVDAPAPGQVSYELRGTGSAGTARELDTLLTALVAHANATRGARADGAATAIAQAATCDAEPLRDRRLVAAAGMTGASALGMGLLGLVAWGRMARGAARYEQTRRVGAMLAEVQWGPGRAG